MNPAYLGGLLVGATIGSVIIGALLGWAIHKITRLDYGVADGIGVLLLPIGIVLGGSDRLDPPIGWLVYGAAALIAYFILKLLRRWMSMGRPKVGAK